MDTAVVNSETPASTAEPLDPNQPVSVEINGIELTGAGETEAELRDGLPKQVEPIDQQPKQSKGRQRYSDLTSERDQERQKREAAERERDELKTRLDALATPKPAEPVRETPRQAPVTEPAPPAPAPAKFTFPGYQAWADANPTLIASSDDPYGLWTEQRTDALTDWKVQQLDIQAQIRHGIEADRAQRAQADSLATVRQRGRTAYPDFDAVITSGPGAAIPFAPTPAQADARARAIIASPHSEHIQYAMGSNPDLTRRLGQMSDVEFGLALASLAPSAPAASPASTGTLGSVVPPPPMQPVGSGSRTTVASAADLAERGGEDYDSSGFREQSRRERGRR